MRVTSDFFVAILVRRANGAGAYAVLRRRGAPEAGAILIKIDRLDGTAELLKPAPQSAFEAGSVDDRRFVRHFAGPVPPHEVEARIEKELSFDPDLWLVEIEDREGRSFVEVVEG